MVSVFDNNFLLSNQDTNQFWCKRELNFKFLIKPLKTLPFELTGIHSYKRD